MTCCRKKAAAPLIPTGRMAERVELIPMGHGPHALAQDASRRRSTARAQQLLRRLRPRSHLHMAFQRGPKIVSAVSRGYVLQPHALCVHARLACQLRNSHIGLKLTSETLNGSEACFLSRTRVLLQ